MSFHYIDIPIELIYNVCYTPILFPTTLQYNFYCITMWFQFHNHIIFFFPILIPMYTIPMPLQYNSSFHYHSHFISLAS